MKGLQNWILQDPVVTELSGSGCPERSSSQAVGKKNGAKRGQMLKTTLCGLHVGCHKGALLELGEGQKNEGCRCGGVYMQQESCMTTAWTHEEKDFERQ